MAQPGVASPIVSVTSLGQLREPAAARLVLEPAHWAALDEASRGA